MEYYQDQANVLDYFINLNDAHVYKPRISPCGYCGQ